MTATATATPSGLVGYFDEPIPCNDCQTPLPRRVFDAVELLYGLNETRDLGTLAATIEQSMIDDARRVAKGETATSDTQLADWAVRSWALGTCETADLAAAVRHAGLVDPNGETECERASAARWCCEPTPDHKGDADDRPPACTLLAAHEGDHLFSWKSVLIDG